MDGDRARTHCAREIRTHDRDRWLVSCLAPPAARGRLHALYGFNLEIAKIRDVVTEPMLGHIRLQWWRETVEGLAAGASSAHPVAEALAPMIADGAVTPADLGALIDAREADLAEEGPATATAFVDYCDATSGALNRLALGVLGLGGDQAAVAAGEKIGRAHAMAGLLRAAAFHAARGRVMLPRALLDAHGVGLPALLAGRPGPGLKRAARTIADEARRELGAARALRGEVPAAALPVLALARFAEASLGRLARDDYDLFGGRLEPLPVTGPLLLLETMATRRY